MFKVYQDGTPADHAHFPEVHESWDKSEFDTLFEAQVYAVHWAQPISRETAKEFVKGGLDERLQVGVPVNLSPCEVPVMMTIQEEK